MHKIGQTQAGMVVVEMTQQEFDAVRLLQGVTPEKTMSAVVPTVSAKAYPDKDDAVTGVSGDEMTLKQAADYCAPRLVKLGPKRKEGVLKSLHTMFNFQGGVSDARVEEIYQSLRSRGVFAENDGKIVYPQ